ncbi:hypothetical protein P4C99_13650 [Pontiellaceae bacterium B1224]|nr:hypothetical protein [Pontiellaceae bacterium B1224]
MKSARAVLITLILTASIIWAAEPSNSERHLLALELERSGNTEAAFLAYLTIPGAEHSAIRLARTAPDEYLALLETAANAPTPTVKLIEGDLLLEKGETNAALACYRAVAASTAADCKTSWSDNQVPWNYYFVEADDPADQLHEPFSWRIGSQRDNWLIRRFITLHVMDDAEREFARVWALHQHDAQPHAVLFPSVNPDAPKQDLNFSPFVVYPNAHDKAALCFALDYARFLERRGKETLALETFKAPLLMMDLNSPPHMKRPAPSLTKIDARNYPPQARSHPTNYYGLGPTLGVSREDFIEHAYDAFEREEKLDELIAVLRNEIENGNNAARLVLARILDHQNDTEGALALELAYIRVADFDHASATYRRGLAYETHQEPEKAAEKYEALLAMKPTEIINKRYIQKAPGQSLFGPVWLRQSSNPNSGTLNDVIESLLRFYTASGKTDKSLDLSLARFELLPACLMNFNMIVESANLYAAAGKESDFIAWAQPRAEREESLDVKANLYWAMNDPQQTLAALSKAENTEQLYPWKSRFKNEAPEYYVELLDLSLTIDSADSMTRLEILDLYPDPLGPDAIQPLEKLLALGAKGAFPRGKGIFIRTRFQNYHDLADRLVRLYEQEEQIDDLVTLGERVALGQQPFPNPGSLKRDTYYFERSEPYVLSILSRLIHYADFQTLERLAEAWRDLPDFPSKRQLERKQRCGFATSSAPPIPWENLPEGVEALASNENVLSLTADDHYVYSGHPWGIAVYDHEGNPVVRVALGAAALTIETCGEFTWVGTPLGLWRIDPETWDVTHLRMDQNVPERDREDGRVDFHNGTLGLAEDGDFLWIGTRRDIRRLDLKNGILRIFTQRELGVSSHHDWKRILVEKNYVWFAGRAACLRYDRATETWTEVERNQTPAQLTGNYWDRNDDPMASPIPEGLRTGTLLENQDGSWSCYDDSTHRHTVFGVSFPASNWSLLSLTNGVRVLGGSHADSPRYIYLNEDRPNSYHRAQDRQRAIHSGGLYFISTNNTPRRVSSLPAANAIPSDLVYSVATGAEGESRWLCGDSGISLLTSNHSVLENIQRADGLPASRIVQATNRNDETWFTSSTEDLIILDQSTVFRPFSKEGTKAAEQNRLESDEITREPFLGGFVVATSRVDKTTFICGTRGLLIFDGATRPAPTSETLEVEIRMDDAVAGRVPHPAHTRTAHPTGARSGTGPTTAFTSICGFLSNHWNVYSPFEIYDRGE